MKIGIDGRKLYEFPSGTSYYIRELVEGLVRNQVDVFVFTNKSSPVKLPGNYIKSHRKNSLPFEQCFIPKQIERCSIDIFHEPANTGLPLLKALPKVLTIHDIIPLLDKTYFSNSAHPLLSKGKYLTKISLNLKIARKIIVISKHTKECLIENFNFINQQKIVKIPLDGNHNNKEDNSILKSLNIARNNFILNNGGIAKRKNINELIEAFMIVKRVHPKLKLVITGEKNNINKLITKGNIERIKKEEKIVLSGSVNSKQMKSLLKEARCLCYPSSHEGFGMPILEAFRAHTPTAISDIPAFREISNKRASAFFNPKKPQEIAEKIQAIINNEKVKARMIKEGKKIASNFSWKKTIQRTINVYENCLH